MSASFLRAAAMIASLFATASALPAGAQERERALRLVTPQRLPGASAFELRRRVQQ